MVTSPGASGPVHPELRRVTERIARRSEATRSAYLTRVERWRTRPGRGTRLGCANLAHTTAALPAADKLRVVAERAPHLGVVTAYNDMLSAHQPYEDYPQRIRAAARSLGVTVQVAGGVPAMCDGITQGQPGMELS
ncbi:MAG: dihydroxy-acid dehydratase, partial [Pseudomonadota bacterium]